MSKAFHIEIHQGAKITKFSVNSENAPNALDYVITRNTFKLPIICIVKDWRLNLIYASSKK